MTRELLERKYPAGTRVKMIQAKNEYRTDMNGTLGTVTGINEFGGIDVKWDNSEINYDLFVGYDRFSVVFGR